MLDGICYGVSSNPEYGQETFDTFKIVPVDDDEVEEYAEQLKAEVDSETAEALEHGI